MGPSLIVDPLAVPVVGTDDHLVAVDPARLTAQALRQSFAAAPARELEIAGDAEWADAPALTAASVLIALVQRDDGLHVLLTQRTAHLRDHAGQISFPGGRAETTDADAVATALREAQEEVGLLPGDVEVIGSLPAYITVTGYRVTPVVGLVQPGFALTLDAFEVDEAFEVPLAFLMNPAHHRRHRVEADGTSRQFLSMPWESASTGRRYFIWGATAAMLRNLYRFLAA